MTLIGELLGGLLGVVAALTQTQTNGASLWGTLNAPLLQPFLSNNPFFNGFPWGLLTAGGTNPYTNAPDTGVIRSYDFTLKRGQIAPDGYQKDVILINGQFPGPMMEANWGDTFRVTVHNQISAPEEGTSLHWHGILQKSTPWFDGVPGVQQCPIAPGSSFTYTFKADLYGTTWYHSHYSAQVVGGLFGPLIIHGPKNADYDIDLGPVMLTDHYHTEYFKILEQTTAPNTDPNFNPAPSSDNNLINGKMNFNCSTVAAGDKAPCNSNAGISKFKFTTGKTHRLRLINAGAEGVQRFSIDGHNLTVMATDLVPIKPYTTNVVTLAIGQRVDVLVTANAGKPNSAFWMRSNISSICSLSNQPFALAAVYYDRSDTSKAPTSSAWNVPDPGTCTDDLSLTIPYYTIKPSTPSVTQNLDIDFHFNATGHFLWTLGANSFRANYDSPVLLLANENNFTYPAEWNVQNFGRNTSMRIVVNNPGPAAHPMHLHGHNMQILSEGPGNWDGTTITNGGNPTRRDTQIVRNGGHMVMQFDADNPGVWPFHCHIVWHVSSGLYANMLESPASIAKFMPIPSTLQKTCKDWTSYSSKDVVDQIDSGV